MWLNIHLFCKLSLSLKILYMPININKHFYFQTRELINGWPLMTYDAYVKQIYAIISVCKC